MGLAENMKKRREELKLSQEYVADRLGVSRQAVSKWETGQTEPTANNLIQLADILETSLSELVNPHKNDEAPSTAKPKKEPNLILRANLTTMALAAQAVFLFNCTQAIVQLRHPDYPNKDLYQGFLIVSLVLLLLSSIWMASNHRFEPDRKQRRINAKIECGYCCIQAFIALLTIRFGIGLVGLALILIILLVYVLYINPKFMSRKLTK